MLFLLACATPPATPPQIQSSESDCPDQPYIAEMCTSDQGDLAHLWEGQPGQGWSVGAAWASGPAQLSVDADPAFSPGSQDFVLPASAVWFVWHGAPWCRYDGACSVQGVSGAVTADGTLVESDGEESTLEGSLNFTFVDIQLENGSTIEALAVEATFE